MTTLDLRLRHLEAFLLVAQLGSFRAAAARLNLTQPAISQRIAELERSIGARLIERTSRACRLTPRGRHFEVGARRLLENAHELRIAATDTAKLTGHVKLGVADSVAVTWLPQLLLHVRESHPGVTLDVEVDLTASLARRLSAAQLDLVCGIDGMLRGPLAKRIIGSFELAWMASPALGVPAARVTPDVLVRFPIIGHTGGHHQAMIAQWLRAARHPPRWVSGCSSLAAIIEMVAAGVGMSLLPVRAVEARLERGELVRIATRPAVPPNHLALAHRLEPLAREIEAVADAILAAGTAWLHGGAAQRVRSRSRSRRAAS
jgi:DNA-binding transcriptional LysR family regulator